MSVIAVCDPVSETPVVSTGRMPKSRPSPVLLSFASATSR